MRSLILLLAFAVSVSAQDVQISVRPNPIYIENAGGNILPVGRLFSHIIIHNVSKASVDIQWVRFDIVGAGGAVISAQFSGQALVALFDSSIERGRIEPTPKGTLQLGPDQRKALTDVFLDLPMGFIGESLVVEVEYETETQRGSASQSVPLRRAPEFLARLPFTGTWYVAREHGFLDPHKRFTAESFAYDFLQVGADGKSYRREGTRNNDYYAYGKKILAVKDGQVVFVRNNVADNIPAERPPRTVPPGGNVVILDHGNNQFSYYAHLRPASIDPRVGDRVRAGDPVGEVGNSGDSAEPQLHFHAMNHADPEQADGLPVVFENWKTESYTAGGGRLQRQGIIMKGDFVQP